MWNREDLAWVAGFFEGEGSVIARYPNGRVTPSLGIYIPQVEREPLENVLNITGLGKIYGPYIRGTTQPIYTYVIQNTEQVQAFCAAVWFWMSTKRRTQISNAILEWKLAHQRKPDALERLKSFMKPLENGCIEWTGWMSTNGQPMFKFSQKPRQEGPVRRYIYEKLNGSIPGTSKIGVTCKTARCVAEEHIYRKGDPLKWR